MRYKSNFLKSYSLEAPMALARERSLECQIYTSKEIKKPVLDIGCGEGMFASILFDEPVDVGVDPNIKELNRAKQYSSYNKLIQCFGHKIPEEDKKFNTIFSNSVMEHIENIEESLHEMRRVLADDGVIYLTLPTDKFEEYTATYQILKKTTPSFIQKKYRTLFNQFWRHYHAYNIDTWEQLFNRCGFKITDSFEYASKKFCMTNSFLTPFAFFSFLTKKVFNKWFLFRKLRKLTSRLLCAIFEKNCELHKTSNGGLIFFELKKI